MGFFVFYLLPLFIGLFLSYKIYTDFYFSRRVGITTYVGLIVLLVVSLTPVVNIVSSLAILIVALITDAFNASELHPGK